jgi:hypothetical protein
LIFYQDENTKIKALTKSPEKVGITKINFP